GEKPLRFRPLLLAAIAVTSSCVDAAKRSPAETTVVAAASPALAATAHRDLVMTSRFCAGCHPAIYAEHLQNTHGRAFLDTEARQATRDFRREDCVRCHTPRPIFETGIGMTPIARRHDLEDSNSCMTCHWKPDYDYSAFDGGAQCKTAFAEGVGEVAA